MKKIIFILLGIVLVGMILAALWWVSEREREVETSRESVIPLNSDMVIQVRPGVALSSRYMAVFGQEMERWFQSLSCRVVETLNRTHLVDTTSRLIAVRVEEQQTLRYLHVLTRSTLLSRGDVYELLSGIFPDGQIKEREYAHRKLVIVHRDEEKICYAVIGGIVLLSESERYVEDAVNLLDDQREKDKITLDFHEKMRRCFSGGGGVNVFLNTSYFSGLLPLFLQKEIMGSRTDLSRWFSWGTLDGNVQPGGVGFNGILHCDSLESSFPAMLKGQVPRHSTLDEVLPSGVKSVSMLALSDVRTYLSALERYRSGAGCQKEVSERKRELTRLFGEKLDENWEALWNGEWAKGIFSHDTSGTVTDGIVILPVYSGSQAKALLASMFKNYAAATGTSESSLRRTCSSGKNKTTGYFKMPVPDFAGVLWGYVLDDIATRYVRVEDNHVVFASSERAMQAFVKDYACRWSVKDQAWYQKSRAQLAANYNWMYVADVPAVYPFYRTITRGGVRDWLNRHADGEPVFSSCGMQWVCEGDILYHTLFLCTGEIKQNRNRVLWRMSLDAPLANSPTILNSRGTGGREIFVQDEANTVYLMDDAGLVRWKLPVDGRVNSDVYRVDYFKNGKFQYLFSTAGHLYLLDRQGQSLPRYPLAFKSACDRGISLTDYDGDKNYRVFAPGVDRRLYLYDLSGDFVEGWTTPRCEHAIVSPVYHFRTGGKDYIVCADSCRLYIRDRRGKERVDVPASLHLFPGTRIYLTKQGGVAKMVFVDAFGEIVRVDFKGNVQRLKDEKMIGGGGFNVDDMDGDGRDEFIYTFGNQLRIHDGQGKLLMTRSWDGATLGFPGVYRLTAKDQVVGIWDEQGNRLFLLNMKGVLKGFPIPGTTPFVVVPSDESVDEFYLFAGEDRNQLSKYGVQR